jgi:hypothetical protein
MRKNKKVLFIPNTSLIPKNTNPIPAKKNIPQWFKDIPPQTENLIGEIEITGKQCMPFMDSFTSGYIQELPCNVEFKYVGFDENGYDVVEFTYDGDRPPVSTRDTGLRKSKRTLPKFDGYYDVDFHWETSWEPQTPKGYSTLYYHPANRFDLPFTSFTGIIDTDKWSICGPMPFLLKRGFEGVIEKGTPIYQMIFIKRDDWTSSASEYPLEKNNKILSTFKTAPDINYKKLFWQKKNYL